MSVFVVERAVVVGRRIAAWQPSGLVDRVRWAFLLSAAANLAMVVGAVTSGASGTVQVAALLGLAWLAVSLRISWRRARTAFSQDLLDPIAMVFVTLGLRDPLAILAVIFAATMFRSLYGTHAAAAARSFAYLSALFVAVAAPGPLHGVADRGAVQECIGPAFALLAMTLVIRVLLVSLLARERASDNDKLLVRASTALLGAHNRHAALAVTVDAARRACRDTPDVVVELLDVGGDGTIRPHGTDAGVAMSNHLADVVADTDGPLLHTLVDVPELDALFGAHRCWLILNLRTGARSENIIAIGAAKPLQAEVEMSLQSLVAQSTLALVGRQAHEELDYRANHDQLTALPNRTYFAKALELTLPHGRIGSHAVLFIDLDDFKLVNDQYGHDVGDELLAMVAQRITSQVRDRDIAARLGGDEFVVLLTDVITPDEPRRISERIAAALAEPVHLSVGTMHISCSIGVAIDGSASVDPAELLRYADVAMYTAKAKGKHRIEFFDGPTHAAALRGRIIAEELGTAIERGELSVDYQPIIDLSNNACTGFEALLRWHHPELGNIPPNDFIHIAERTGDIVPIGAWVLNQACEAAVRWRKLAGNDKLDMAVNISAVQLADHHLIETVQEACADSGLPPTSLILELTESQLVDSQAAAAQLERLRSLGVRFAVDDFGTGYSSLAYLGNLPVSVVKIDRSFTSRTTRQRPDDLTRAVVTISASLHLTTIAEGVESAAQAAALRTAGADCAQGYYYARPMPAADVPAWLEQLAAEPTTALVSA